ncbi:MAG: hypothetical protein V8S33_07975 [Intestinibacter bartlettii]
MQNSLRHFVRPTKRPIGIIVIIVNRIIPIIVTKITGLAGLLCINGIFFERNEYKIKLRPH